MNRNMRPENKDVASPAVKPSEVLNELRDALNAVIDETIDRDKRARLEVAREYFCNPEFRNALADYVWNINR